MEWNIGTTKSTFNAKGKVTEAINNRKLVGQSDAITKFGQYNVVGIDVTKVDSMRNAISTYCNGLEKKLQEINEKADPEKNAFKGENVVIAVRTYIRTVEDYCTNLVSQLRAFSDKLQDVKEAWEKHTREMEGFINEKASSIDTGYKYKESK